MEAFHQIEGSNIVNVHASVAMPINAISPTETSPWGLRLVPFATLAASGSVDLIAGGLIGGGGLLATALLDFDNVTLSFSTQLSTHQGITLRYQDFEFDPGIDQQILKNGLKATFRYGENLYVYTSIVYTEFLRGAAVDTYWTPGVGVGFRTQSNFSLTVGYSGDFSDGYRSDGFRAMLQLPF